VVYVAVRQDDGCDGGVARFPVARRLQLRGCADLLPDIGRGVDDNPAFAVRRDRDAGLSTRDDVFAAIPREARQPGVAVPLRETASSARAKNLDEQSQYFLLGYFLQVRFATASSVDGK
jgi:hypothetical protein